MPQATAIANSARSRTRRGPPIRLRWTPQAATAAKTALGRKSTSYRCVVNPVADRKSKIAAEETNTIQVKTRIRSAANKPTGRNGARYNAPTAGSMKYPGGKGYSGELKGCRKASVNHGNTGL